MDPITLALLLAAAGGGIGAAAGGKGHRLKGALMGAGLGAMAGTGLGAMGVGGAAAAGGAAAGSGAAAGTAANAVGFGTKLAGYGSKALKGLGYANQLKAGMQGLMPQQQPAQIAPLDYSPAPVPMQDFNQTFARPMAPQVQMANQYGGYYG